MGRGWNAVCDETPFKRSRRRGAVHQSSVRRRRSDPGAPSISPLFDEGAFLKSRAGVLLTNEKIREVTGFFPPGWPCSRVVRLAARGRSGRACSGARPIIVLVEPLGPASEDACHMFSRARDAVREPRVGPDILWLTRHFSRCGSC